MIKLERYNPGALQSVSMMKTRARVQYSDGDVYMVDIPKFMMDDDKYEEIPDLWYDTIDKYKRKI